MIRKQSPEEKVRKSSLKSNIRNHYWIYLMLIPGLLCMVVFTFLPYYGISIAFKDFNIFASSNPIKAIAASPWVGFENFYKIMGSSSFFTVFRNTLAINGLKIIFVFPIPIILALFICELSSHGFRKLTQTMLFVPYFFSWVIIFGIFKSALGTYGIVNTIFQRIGSNSLSFFTDYSLFRFVLVFTDGWKNITGKASRQKQPFLKPGVSPSIFYAAPSCCCSFTTNGYCPNQRKTLLIQASTIHFGHSERHSFHSSANPELFLHWP